MSIIVSVYLKEGIVMSADSRLTGITPCKDGVRDQYTVSDNGQKLFLIKNGNSLSRWKRSQRNPHGSGNAPGRRVQSA